MIGETRINETVEYLGGELRLRQGICSQLRRMDNGRFFFKSKIFILGPMKWSEGSFVSHFGRTFFFVNVQVLRREVIFCHFRFRPKTKV